MIFNGLGRFALGALGDHFGYKRTMVGVAVALTFFIGTLCVGKLGTGAFWEKPVFFILVCLIAFFMGGNFSIVPALTVKYFGMEHFGMNYGFIWSGVSVAALLSGVTSTML